MMRASMIVLLFVLAPFALAADPPALTVTTAQGTVDKIEKDALSVRPRRPDGKFDKTVIVKLTGTSKLALVSRRAAGGKSIVVQRDADKGDLKSGQTIALIYTTLADGNVLLSAVVLPAAGK